MDGKFTQADLKEIYNLAKVIETSSLCGLGQAAGNPIFSMLRFFSNELVVKAE
jgi:NADH:ubiquinone oxidoreductase subunit F (NADH-binding)